MKKYFIAVLTFLLAAGCEQQDKTTSSLETHSNSAIDAFFKKVQQNNYNGALQELLSENENIDLADSSTIHLQRSFAQINTSSGSYVSSKLLRKKQLNDDIGVFTYLVKYEKKFYRFLFVFYNNDKEIKIYKFYYDDVIDIEMQEAIRLYAS